MTSQLPLPSNYAKWKSLFENELTLKNGVGLSHLALKDIGNNKVWTSSRNRNANKKNLTGLSGSTMTFDDVAFLRVLWGEPVTENKEVKRSLIEAQIVSEEFWQDALTVLGLVESKQNDSVLSLEFNPNLLPRGSSKMQGVSTPTKSKSSLTMNPKSPAPQQSSLYRQESAPETPAPQSPSLHSKPLPSRSYTTTTTTINSKKFPCQIPAPKTPATKTPAPHLAETPSAPPRQRSTITEPTSTPTHLSQYVHYMEKYSSLNRTKVVPSDRVKVLDIFTFPFDSSLDVSKSIVNTTVPSDLLFTSDEGAKLWETPTRKPHHGLPSLPDDPKEYDPEEDDSEEDNDISELNIPLIERTTKSPILNPPTNYETVIVLFACNFFNALATFIQSCRGWSSPADPRVYILKPDQRAYTFGLKKTSRDWGFKAAVDGIIQSTESPGNEICAEFKASVQPPGVENQLVAELASQIYEKWSRCPSKLDSDITHTYSHILFRQFGCQQGFVLAQYNKQYVEYILHPNGEKKIAFEADVDEDEDDGGEDKEYEGRMMRVQSLGPFSINQKGDILMVMMISTSIILKDYEEGKRRRAT